MILGNWLGLKTIKEIQHNMKILPLIHIKIKYSNFIIILRKRWELLRSRILRKKKIAKIFAKTGRIWKIKQPGFLLILIIPLRCNCKWQLSRKNSLDTYLKLRQPKHLRKYSYKTKSTPKNPFHSPNKAQKANNGPIFSHSFASKYANFKKD